MTSDGSKTRIKWEGDSNAVIRAWPDDIKQNMGAELDRLENYEDPLNSKPMGKSLPGIHELSDEDKDIWYRLLYTLRSGWIYVLHCFKKKTNQTSRGDVEKAKDRLKAVKARKDKPFAEDSEGEEKSA